MTGLRIALVVPEPGSRQQIYRAKQLARRVAAGEVDLCVFPECFFIGDKESPFVAAETLADEVGGPVLTGVGFPDSDERYFQAATYLNPRPKTGETRTHLYIKHSTSDLLAFDWPDYRGARDRMFDPILLGGKRAGVLICHDMFFGLVPQMLYERGAELIVNLTGGAVNARKWKTMLRARSRELKGLYLCTMSERPDASGSSFAVGYRDGGLLRPQIDETHDGVGGFVVYDTSTSELVEEDTEQEFSKNIYSDVRLRLEPGTVGADLSVAEDGKVNGQRAAAWINFNIRGAPVRVMVRPTSELLDAGMLYRKLPADADAIHLVVFVSDHAVDGAWAMDLMRLRAVEHRIAVAVRAPNLHAVVKTNRYKNIQRFAARDGVYGINREFTGGTWSTAGGKPGLGIPEDVFQQYLDLGAKIPRKQG